MRMTMLRRYAWLLLLSGTGLAACATDDDGDVVQTEFIAVRRAWRPGERDSVVAAVIANRSFNVLYVGDLSDNADLMLSPDSTSDILVNPNYVSPMSASPFGPSFSVASSFGTRVPGGGWTSTGLDVNINGPGDDNYWLGVFWSNDADDSRKGIILAATTVAATTFPTTTVNTTTYDAAFGLAGVAGAEINPTTAPDTYWENRGEGGTYRVISTAFSGGFNTITTGAFLGGTLRYGTQNEVINNVIMTRRLGTGTPASLTASLSGTITAWEMICNFPTPCTTNVPGLAAAALRGPLPDSLFVKLPWIAAMPAEQRTAAVRAYAVKRAARQR